METAVIHCVYLLLPVIVCNGFQVQGPSAPLTVQLGHSVMLPCFVKTPLPIGELEVEWKRNESLVHLWQEGVSRPESQNQRYHERAHFFTEEIAHGNFSLFLTNVTREDSGVYKCVVYTDLESDETLIELKEIERLIVSGAHSTSAYAGEDITLNCSVDSHISPDNIEEVSWQKIDGNILVLLYQEGEVLTDSSDKRYRDRVEFFSTEERNKGNFSLRLKDVQTGDKGLYICKAFSGTLSANTTVEVRQLGFSSMHIGMFVLCILGFVIGSLILGYLSYTSIKHKDNSSRARAIQWAHVLCPNITMSIVFILWSITEGFISEAVTCSVINLMRIFLLLWISFHLGNFTGVLCKLIYYMALPLHYTVTNAVAFSFLIVDNWHKETIAGRNVIIGCLTLLSFHPFLVFPPVLIRKKCNGLTFFTEFNNSIRIFFIIILYGRGTVSIFWTVLSFAGLTFCCSRNHIRNQAYLIWISVLMVLGVLSAAVSIYTCYNFVDNMKERDAVTCVTIFIYILEMMILFTYDVESLPFNDNNTNTSLSYLVVHVFGTALVILVNAVALLVELILKTRNGERTMDLRVILLPTESVFAVCCLALIISALWKKKKAGLRKDAKKIRGWCMCKQLDRNSPPHNEVQELRTLNPEPQPSGS